MPQDAAQKAVSFNQLSVEIEDDEIDGEVEGHNPTMRKVSTTYDYHTDKKHPLTSPLTTEEHIPTTIIIDDNNNDDAMADDVVSSNNDVIIGKSETENSRQGQEVKDDCSAAKDAGIVQVAEGKMGDAKESVEPSDITRIDENGVSSIC